MAASDRRLSSRKTWRICRQEPSSGAEKMGRVGLLRSSLWDTSGSSGES